MHFASLRSDKPFHALNLAGMTDELAMVELFGAKRGILPGGVNKIGLAQKADRGTLFVEGIEHACRRRCNWRCGGWWTRAAFPPSAGRR
jgi:two-component system response regulator HupR/HoxA